MNGKLEKDKAMYSCGTCGKVTSAGGHLCNPVPLEDAFTCQECGAVTSDPGHVCKPRMAKIDYVCSNCGRVAMDKNHLCNPRSLFWSPQVDLYETEDNFVVIADLPGVVKDDLILELTHDNLEIKGERKVNQDSGHYHVTERMVGSFDRTLVLPDGIDRDKIQATFKDGILEINLPKAKEYKPRKVAIAIQ